MPANSNNQDDDNRLEDFSVGGPRAEISWKLWLPARRLKWVGFELFEGFPGGGFLKRDQPESNPHNDT